ncbi:MAG: hypothetical protein FWF05_05885 [Oscillospiraceae bacterium]|nr:hypothetical protein [Oscillospiraceae bacterium]
MKKMKRILKVTLKTLAIFITAVVALVTLIVAVPFTAGIGLKTEALPADASVTLKRAAIGERYMLGLGRIADGLTRVPEDMPDVETYESEHFYPGGENAGEVWRLGYAQAVITPEDWETKTYYEGGNLVIPQRKLTDKLDELKVRVVALSASADGGVSIFAAVDSIGVTNKQVRQIRALVSDMGLLSVNIAATHVHTAVDPLGFYSKGGKADQDYIAFVNEKAAGAIREAVAAMEPGRLYMSQIGSVYPKEYSWQKIDAMIGFDTETDQWDDEWDEKYDARWEEIMSEMSAEEYGLGDYISSRRSFGGTESTRMNKLRFEPLNPGSKETVWLNFAAHPFRGGYAYGGWPADKISGDYIYYMEELIDESGANMIFVNGAVNGINPNDSQTADKSYYEYESDEEYYEARSKQPVDWKLRRMGRDFAAIALAMTMAPEEIAQNPLTDPDADHGYEYRRIVTMMQNKGTVTETELAPSLDIRLSEMRLDIENPLVHFVAKRGMLNMNLLRDGKSLAAVTEVGYMELGGAVTVALVPGEFTPGLAWRGGDSTKEFSIRQRDFAYPTFSESAGREVLVFGLCNDELGYIIPDNDHVMFYVPRGVANALLKTWDYDHYAELLSPSRNAAGVFADAFAELAGR